LSFNTAILTKIKFDKEGNKMRLRTKIFIVLILTLLATPAQASEPSLDIMIGQMLMAGFRGYTVDETSPIIRDIRDYHLGGVILFDYDVTLGSGHRNIKNPEQVKALTKALHTQAKIPLFMAIDQEGGKVQRLKPKYGFTGTPSQQKVGEENDTAIGATALIAGYTIKTAGFNVNFAPVVDVNVNPQCPVIGKIGRSFSSDPYRVAHCAEIFLHEFKRLGITGCLKHFPGHGSAGADSHLGLTDVTNTWTEMELIPYKILIDKKLPKMIMTAHIFDAKLDPDYPATLSHRIITGILRDKLKYDGVVVTDDMTMKAITKFYGRKEAIRLAINAGADILLFGNNIDFDRDVVPKAHAIIKKLVTEGEVSKDRIKQSYARIMLLKKEQL
jgi:beta-N-acetylhexosaminidase